MALLPICHKMPYKEQAHSLSARRFLCNEGRHLRGGLALKDHPGFVLCVSEHRTTYKQLKSLDFYFGKLEAHADTSSDGMRKQVDAKTKIKAKEELGSLNAYLTKLKRDSCTKDYDLSTFDDQFTENNPAVKPLSFSRNPTSQLRDDSYDDISDLYLICILASINIAVFLFEIASPVENTDLNLFSLPSLYGAKINDMILVGEWWRLVTPMFLHSGIFHVALGCWSLLTFGPPVCRGYGSFTFFLIYFLGGFSGNLMSFFHTPAPTVGGTGPVFAIIGAWLIYQVQNKDVIAKDVSDKLFENAIFATGISLILSHFGPVDDWTHLGAALTGIAFGFFTGPAVQMDSSTGQEEGFKLVTSHTDPRKSLVVFVVLVMVLSSMFFVIDPPIYTPVSDDDMIYTLLTM